MYECEGTYVANQGNDTHLQPQQGGTIDLVDAGFTYHYGAAGIGPVHLPRVGRSEAQALRAAALTSQAALDAAIATLGLATDYAGLVAQADAAQVPALYHPRRLFRAWALSLVDLPAPPTN